MSIDPVISSLRAYTVETICFKILLPCAVIALVVWGWGMARKSFGTVPAMLCLVFSVTSLICAGVVGILELVRR